jgi:retron-type reverse transcriptase
MGINIIINDYIELLENSGHKPMNIPEGSTEIEHLLWMLHELNNNSQMSDTKKHRWLGFIQGCLIKDDLIDLSHERSRTRPILNGK